MKRTGRLERFVERLLATGLAASAALLALGLAIGGAQWMRAGILLLMLTPGLRVIVLTAGLLARRDYVFAALSLGALLVLASSAAVAFRL
jgi:uncharacterized membrane protein